MLIRSDFVRTTEVRPSCIIFLNIHVIMDKRRGIKYSELNLHFFRASHFIKTGVIPTQKEASRLKTSFSERISELSVPVQ